MSGGSWPPFALISGVWAARGAVAEDWGAYAIVPMSAPALTLEIVGSEWVDGAVVSIGKPTGGANQKWLVVPKGNNRYSIKPFPGAALVLAAARGGTANGTPIVLATDTGQPWQEWALTRNDNGSYGLVAGHDPGRGLDHLGGKPTPGAKIDLWTNTPGDQHLQWLIRPLAGSPTPLAPGVG